MHVVHQEDAVAEAGEQRFHFLAVEGRVLRSGGPFETVEHAQLVALGLQAAEKPCADVGERLVIEVHRILGGEQAAEPESAALFENCHHRPL